MRFILLVATLLTSLNIAAQSNLESERFKPYFVGTLSSGVQVGCGNCATGNQLSVSAYFINGLQFTRRFAVGIGVGADSYQQLKTLPLFIQLSEKLVGKKNGLFLQLNAGYAWAWYDRTEYTLPNYNQIGGIMIHPAIAYQIGVEKINLIFSIGFKRQIASYSYRYDYQNFAGVVYNEYIAKSELNRFVLQIGFGWRY